LKFAAVLAFASALFSGAPALAARPTRVVALSPALAEIAATLIASATSPVSEPVLVGVTDYADTPESVRKLPSVGAYSRFNLEKVVALKPDLVLATSDGNPRDQIEHLRALGKRVEVIQTHDLEEVAKSFEKIGEVLGYREAGQAMARDFRAELARLAQKAATGPRAGRTIAMQLGDDPLIFIGGALLYG
jgi:iron complex transport system substrate-binding protein